MPTLLELWNQHHRPFCARLERDTKLCLVERPVGAGLVAVIFRHTGPHFDVCMRSMANENSQAEYVPMSINALKREFHISEETAERLRAHLRARG